MNKKVDFLTKLHAKYFIQQNDLLYLGTYPTEKNLKEYQIKYGLQRVITLLDPTFPVSRELVEEEKKQCALLGIELIVVPISFFSQQSTDYIIIPAILKDTKKITLIHTYYFDARMEFLRYFLKRY